MKTVLEWHKGPDLGGEGTAGKDEQGRALWYDGDVILAVFELIGGREYYILFISCDEDFFSVKDTEGNEFCAWSINDVSWWAKITDEVLPPFDTDRDASD